MRHLTLLNFVLSFWFVILKAALNCNLELFVFQTASDRTGFFLTWDYRRSVFNRGKHIKQIHPKAVFLFMSKKVKEIKMSENALHLVKFKKPNKCKSLLCKTKQEQQIPAKWTSHSCGPPPCFTCCTHTPCCVCVWWLVHTVRRHTQRSSETYWQQWRGGERRGSSGSFRTQEIFLQEIIMQIRLIDLINGVTLTCSRSSSTKLQASNCKTHKIKRHYSF